MLADIGDQPFRIAEGVVAQRKHCSFGSHFDALDIGAPAQRFDRHHLQQIFDLVWEPAEAVDELCGERLDGALVLDLGEATVQSKPHR